MNRSTSLEDRILEMEAVRDIRELMFRYCDAADRRDWDRFRSVFHSDSTQRHGEVFEGTSAEFAAMGEMLMAHVQESHHQVGNVVVAVTGLRARCQCYFSAHHLIAANAPALVFPMHRPGIDEYWWVGGRYFDCLEYRDGAWGIVHRDAVHDWEHWEIADARGFVRHLANIPGPIG